MELPTLYKITSTGAVQTWSVRTYGSNPAYLEVKFGQLDGKIQTKIDKFTEGKNIGKSNETTPLQQADKECLAKWTKQIERKGYSEQVEEMKSYSPMLAHKYLDNIDKVTFPCYVQPKMDGIRCIAIAEKDRIVLMSRRNKPFEVLQHIEDKLDFMTPGMVLDGELFNKDIPVTTINGFCKKEQDGTKKIQYHIYDIIQPGTFTDRLVELQKIKNCDIIKTVSTRQATNHEDIYEHFKSYLEDGYEGCMIRQAGGIYKSGYRSTDLLKLKEFQDEDFIILDVRENDKMPGTGVFVLVTKDGNEFKAMPEGTMEQRKQYLTNKDKYIGGIGIVRFFDWTKTDNPVPFHPVFVRVRGENE